MFNGECLLYYGLHKVIIYDGTIQLNRVVNWNKQCSNPIYKEKVTVLGVAFSKMQVSSLAVYGKVYFGWVKESGQCESSII